ncbi:GumC family protein [Oricola sp.]|uniref:GumC family protein n=1 Tax=Oricola sp. TaxID=1979950 RepID=UPI003516BC75
MFRPEDYERRQAARSDSSARTPLSLLEIASEFDQSEEKPDERDATSLHEHPEPGHETAYGRTPDPITENSQTASNRRSISGQFEQVGVDDIIEWLAQGTRLIVWSVVLCVAAALLFGFLATPKYKVYTDILVAPANLNVVREDVFESSPQSDAQILEVESRLRVLTSRNVLSRVIDDLNLTEDPEFVKPSPFAAIKNLFASNEEVEANTRLAVMRELSERVEASREQRSFIVVLETWREDPEKAVELADAMVKAFEQEMFESAASSAGRVARDINARLKELRRSATEAETRVEAFRRENGLAVAGNELERSRLSSELNSQVLEAQQRLIQEQTQYQQMRAALNAGRTRSASVFESDTMSNLREQYNELRQRIGSLELSLGPRHPQLLQAQSELEALENAINDEARAILDRARASYEREQTALAALQAKAGEETSNVFVDNEAEVQLRDLERDATAKAQLYETFLTRSQQITESQQIDTTNIRVISSAVPPKAPSWPPRKLILMAGGVAAGLMIGVGLALLLGFRRSMRSMRLANA